MDEWKAGFSTRLAAFEWVASSSFYHPSRINDGQRNTKARLERPMYQAFLQWNEAQAGFTEDEHTAAERETLSMAVREDALIFFGKKDEHDACLRENQKRIRLREMWNGKKIGEWTGWYGHIVGRVMHHVKEAVGEGAISEMEESELRDLVMKAKMVIESKVQAEKEAT